MSIRKASPSSAKADAKDPSILHIVGSTEAVDRMGDVIRVAGWDLTAYKQNPVFMWGHDYTQPPIGTALKVVKNLATKRLEFIIRFAKDNPFAQTIQALYRDKVLRMSSVGFNPKTSRPLPPEKGLMVMEGGTEFLKQELLELSAVPIGANQEALTMSLQRGAVSKAVLEDMGFELRTHGVVVPKDLDPDLTDPTVEAHAHGEVEIIEVPAETNDEPGAVEQRVAELEATVLAQGAELGSLRAQLNASTVLRHILTPKPKAAPDAVSQAVQAAAEELSQLWTPQQKA